MTNLHLPKIIFEGEGALEDFISYLREEGYNKIFVVTDKVIKDLEIFRDFMEKLEGFVYEVFCDVEPEPSLETVYNLGEVVKRFSPEVIIAFGGGSVIDAAKGGWAIYEKPDLNLEEISPFVKIGTGKKAILTSIPTTSGTGSEATLAVVYSKYVDNVKEKIALGSYELVSTIVVLDPNIVLNLPRELTIYTALDALTHAVESYVATQANIFTQALAEKAILTIFEYLPQLLNDMNNIDLRGKIHLAADMAGVAFSNSGLGLAHAIGHVVGGRYHIHHGKAVSIILPYVVKYNYSCEEVASKYDWISTLIVEKGLSDKAPLYEQIYRFIQEIGGKTNYRDLVDASYLEELDELIPLILQDPDSIYNPIVPSEEDIRRLLEEAYYEKI